METTVYQLNISIFHKFLDLLISSILNNNNNNSQERIENGKTETTGGKSKIMTLGIRCSDVSICLCMQEHNLDLSPC